MPLSHDIAHIGEEGGYRGRLKLREGKGGQQEEQHGKGHDKATRGGARDNFAQAVTPASGSSDQVVMRVKLPILREARAKGDDRGEGQQVHQRDRLGIPQIIKQMAFVAPADGLPKPQIIRADDIQGGRPHDGQ